MSENDTPTARLKKAAHHESTSLFTRALIALGIAYLCWSSNRLINGFDDHGKAIQTQGKQVERIAVTLQGTDRTVDRIEKNQREIRSKVDEHVKIPAHPVAATMHKRIADDIEEIKDEIKKRR